MLNKILSMMWKKIRTLIFGPKSKFKPGDSVQHKEGGCLMVVREVITNNHLKEPILNCRWYDPLTKANRTNLFDESKLKFFDWHLANDTTDLVVNKNGKVQSGPGYNFPAVANNPEVSNPSKKHIKHVY